tara:strand:+ start:3383 stop:3712 length:330 start_codon:yes stop_codon:yes gene_type:complete
MSEEKDIWVEFKRKKSLVSEPKTCWKFVILDSTKMPSKYDRLNHLVVTENQIPKDIISKLVDSTFNDNGFFKRLVTDKQHDLSVQCYLTQDQIINLIKSVEGEVDDITA